MSFDEGLGIFLWVLVVIGAVSVIVLYRRGRIKPAMAAGLILVGVSMAADVPLPTVAPGLADMPIKASWIGVVGWLLVLVSMIMTLREKKKSS